MVLVVLVVGWSLVAAEAVQDRCSAVVGTEARVLVLRVRVQRIGAVLLAFCCPCCAGNRGPGLLQLSF